MQSIYVRTKVLLASCKVLDDDVDNINNVTPESFTEFETEMNKIIREASNGPYGRAMKSAMKKHIKEVKYNVRPGSGKGTD